MTHTVTKEDNDNQLLKNIISGSSINSFGTIFNKIIRYFSVMIVIKVLGVYGYGYYSIATNIVGMALIFANFGLNYGIFRFVPIFLGKNNIAKVKGVILFTFKRITVLGIVVASIMFICSEQIAVSIFNKPDLVQYF